MDSTGEAAAGASRRNPLLHGKGGNCHIKQGFGDISVRLLLRPDLPLPIQLCGNGRDSSFFLPKGINPYTAQKKELLPAKNPLVFHMPHPPSLSWRKISALLTWNLVSKAKCKTGDTFIYDWMRPRRPCANF